MCFSYNTFIIFEFGRVFETNGKIIRKIFLQNVLNKHVMLNIPRPLICRYQSSNYLLFHSIHSLDKRISPIGNVVSRQSLEE